jgi:hypothetical protein
MDLLIAIIYVITTDEFIIDLYRGAAQPAQMIEDGIRCSFAELLDTLGAKEVKRLYVHDYADGRAMELRTIAARQWERFGYEARYLEGDA